MNNKWISNYINEISEDENDPQEISVGNYQTKYFHVCPGASKLYGDIESKGVDMDMAERSARLQDALYFVEEHIQRDGYNPEKDYVMVAKNIAKNIMKMAEMMGLEKEHDYIQGHVDTIEKVVKEKGLEEKVMELTEENVPTNPSKWSYYKSQAKKKFDVYPSAYANAWAAKQYKAAGGGWRTKKKESVNEAKSMDTSKRLKVYDKLKKGDEITIKYGSSMSSGREGKFKVTKGKTLVGKQKVERIILQNVKNPKGVKFYLYQRNGNVTMAIGDMAATIEDMHESVNEARKVNPKSKKFLKGMKKIKVKGLGGWMPGVDYVYVDGDKYYFVDFEGDHMELKNTNTIKQLHKLHGSWSDGYNYTLGESINEAKEPEVITQLRKIVKNKQNDLIKDTKSGKKVRVDMNSANLMVQVYDALKKQSNKDKFVKSGIAMMGHTAYKLMKKENITEYDVENQQDIKEFTEFMKEYQSDINEAEYQGRDVKLGKIMQGDVKKFKVYVNNDKGNVVKVNFGQKGMTIKKDNPGARKSFRARMNCDSPGPRWKARYWSCRKW